MFIVLVLIKKINLDEGAIVELDSMEGGKREEQIMIAGYKKHIGFYPHPITI
jgi:hypothetical protein